MGHNYIGTEALLLALAKEDGIASKALEALGISYADIWDAIRDQLDAARMSKV